MNIAVTGGLGTGKSTVCKILAAALATELVDTDELCRQQMLPGTEGFEKFCRVFGEKFLQGDGSINRAFLRQMAFENPEIRTKLESILHPIVRRDVATRCWASSAQEQFLVVEVPLLYEVGWQDEFDVCVVVYIPEITCIERVMVRNGMSVEAIKQILKAQIPLKKKLDSADFIIDNSSTFVSTVHQVSWLSRKLSRAKREALL